MTVSLLKPLFLLLLLGLPLLWWRASVMTSGQKLIRALAFVLIVIGLAQPVMRSRGQSRHLVFILDQSGSVPVAEKERARNRVSDLVARATAEDKTTVIVVGKSTITVPGCDEVIHISPAASDLSAALDLAVLKIQDQSAASVTLLSDGETTRRSWRDAVQDLASRGIPVHTIQLSSRSGDLYPSKLSFEGELRVGHPSRGHLQIVGAQGPVSLTLSVGKEEILKLDQVNVGADREIAFTIEPKVPGFRTFRATITGEDSLAANNTLSQTWAVQSPIQVLYLGSRVQGGASSIGQLVGSGFQLTDSHDKNVRPFADYDLILVDDLPAAEFATAGQEELIRAVQEQGVGVLVCGGPASFGPGGYYGTPLADALPVRFLQKEEKRDPSTSLVVILDTSGSMGGTRVQLAKEVARLAMRRLLPHDKVGIVEFYGAKRWAAPLQPASNVIEIQRALNRLQAGGGTVIMPALEEAYYGLQNVNTRYKHVLVLTDGGVESGAFEPLIRKMSEKGVNVSTVLIGPQAHNDFLVSLSQWGKGRFYAVPNRFNLPEIILKQPTSSRLPAYRQGQFAVKAKGTTFWWGNLKTDSIPPLSAFVELRTRPGAESPLVTQTGNNPIVASWMLGRGRLSVLATEPAGPGTRGWQNWDGFGAFLAHLMTRSSRSGDYDIDYQLSRNGNDVRLSAESKRSRTVMPSARFLDGKSWQPWVFRRRSPSQFDSHLWWDESQDVACVVDTPGRPPRRLILAETKMARPELQVGPDATLDLKRLAAECGGLHEPLGGNAIRPTESIAIGPTQMKFLAPWFFLLALLTYIGDVFNRRRDRLLR